MKKAKFVKAAGLPKAAAGGKGASPGDFLLVAGTGDTVTVTGADQFGNPVDISGVATIVVTSATPTIVTASPVTGMTYPEKAVGPVGTSDITVVATWTDGSVGPFTLTYTDTVSAGPAGGLTISHGPVTVN